MEIKRTYWRNAYNNQFKPELAKSIGNFIIGYGIWMEDGSVSYALKEGIELLASDGKTVNVRTLNTTVKKKKTRKGYDNEIPDKVVISDQGLNIPIEYLTVDSMMLLLDAIDQEVFNPYNDHEEHSNG